MLHFIAECRQYLAARVEFASNFGDIGVQFNLRNILGGGEYDDSTQMILKYLVRYISATGRVDSL